MAEKILIIDDDLDTLRLVGLMLQKQGFETMSASSGQEGIDLALSENSPDLILLDVMMPGMDGYQVARKLRADVSTREIPILMFTAKSQLEDKVAGFESGVDDYLTKPTHPTELQAHVRALLARSSKKKPSVIAKIPDEPGYLIGVLAVRGGLGVTTVALDLAGSLEKKTASDVILAEFRPGQGTLSYDLGIDKRDGLSDMLKLPADEISRDMVGDKLIRLKEGVRILPSSSRPKHGAYLSNFVQFSSVLKNLQLLSHYVVIDLGNGLSPLVQHLAPSFNEMIVVVEPFLNSLHHSQALIDDLSIICDGKIGIYVVVNYRQRSDTPALSVLQIQSNFRTPVEISLMPAPELYQMASRRHMIASQITLDSLTSLQFQNLAEKVVIRSNRTVIS